jgi:hypothetical protein
MKRAWIVIAALAALAAGTSAVRAKVGHSAAPSLFIVDDSSSMAEVAGDSSRPTASRWNLVQEAYPRWIENLGAGVPAGVVSVGGSCGGPARLRLPVGSERGQVAVALNTMGPDGNTNLNAVLESAPALFPAGAGEKRIVLLSDGLNTCEPFTSTCDVARELHSKYNIAVDVVRFPTEPSAESEFRCIAAVSGGSYSAVSSLSDLMGVLPSFNLMPLVALVSGIATLAAAARVLYRHTVHVLHSEASSALSAAIVLFFSGVLALYLTLFAGQGWVATLAGLATAIFVVLALSRSARSSHSHFQSGRWASFALLALLGLSRDARAQALPASCHPQGNGTPRFHHILAIDVSGSVLGSLKQMKRLLACYAASYTTSGEEITLIAFAFDKQGGVRELRTFTVPANGSTDELNLILDDLAIQNPHETRTYYRPLADFLNGFLEKVRLSPVILVVSDGRSDGFADARNGLVSFREIPFASFAKRGLYRAPGVTGWQVAIQGGEGLDLTALFQRPIPDDPSALDLPLGPVLTPCLIDPEMRFKSAPELSLRPDWNPFHNIVHGVFRIQIHNECVTRLRSFTVEMRRGDDTIEIGKISSMPVDVTERSIDFPLTLAASGAEISDGSVQIRLHQGNGTRMVYPESGASVIRIVEVPYWQAYGLYWSAGLLLLIGTAILILRGKHAQQRRLDNEPETLETAGDGSITLLPGRSYGIGRGCPVHVPLAPAGAVIASITRGTRRGVFSVRPEPGYRVLIEGQESDAFDCFRAGMRLEVQQLKDGARFEVPLYACSLPARKSGRGATPRRRVRSLDAEFPEFDTASFPDLTVDSRHAFRASGGAGLDSAPAASSLGPESDKVNSQSYLI